MEDFDNKLLIQIKYMIELETRKLLIQNARFNKIVMNEYENKIRAFETDLDNKVSLYGGNMDFMIRRNEILELYKAEFQKIFKKRKQQFFGIQEEIQDLQANQKLAIANYKKFEEYRKVYSKTAEYQSFVQKKEQLQYMMQNATTEQEADNYKQKIESMKDPIADFIKKMDALVERYNGYDAIIKECEIKLEECIKATLDDFESIAIKKDTSLVKVKEPNGIMVFINKLINMFSQNSHFEKRFVNKYKDQISKITEQNNSSIKNIESQTMNLIITINKLRDIISEEFAKNAG